MHLAEVKDRQRRIKIQGGTRVGLDMLQLETIAFEKCKQVRHSIWLVRQAYLAHSDHRLERRTELSKLIVISQGFSEFEWLLEKLLYSLQSYY